MGYEMPRGIALGAMVDSIAGGRAMAAEATAPGGYSGWRGGIGIAFGNPSRTIPDVTELGYEIAWGSDDTRAVKTLDLLSSATGTRSLRRR